ncbi:hypothetical protein EMCG_08344 [[Emmonsia] crescens]|uniref:Protein kinase domain-containing protein n=1 Tax=[Emmonsia] crescens TaxID=73230 RepID=A0A0G2J4K5_9EURO|nr:hypothetical protein EMCG_08344 [Emmonsia crescens UAMH 3008]
MDCPPAIRANTCWNIWLKHRKQYCPFLEDRRDISSDIEFLELLAAAGHSYVIKVRLQGNVYALKLYTLLQPHWSPSRFEKYALTEDPFIVECQVYDYLIEKKLVGVASPHCHGWLTIDNDQERKLARKLHQTFEWRRRPDTARDPVRGLLLEYVEGYTLDKAHMTPLAAQSLRDQLNYLHSLDIAHGDFLPRNIMVSNDSRAFLIDFSSAILWPHPNFLVRKREDFLRYIENEKSALELFLFRLQMLKRHQGMKFTDAASEEEAYGGPLSNRANNNYAFVD